MFPEDISSKSLFLLSISSSVNFLLISNSEVSIIDNCATSGV